MGVQLDSAKFIEDYKEDENAKGVDAEELLNFTADFYGSDPEYPGKPMDFDKICTQAQKMCTIWKQLASQNFLV